MLRDFFKEVGEFWWSAKWSRAKIVWCLWLNINTQNHRDSCGVSGHKLDKSEGERQSKLNSVASQGRLKHIWASRLRCSHLQAARQAELAYTC